MCVLYDSLNKLFMFLHTERMNCVTFSSHLTENTACFYQKDQTVNAVQENNSFFCKNNIDHTNTPCMWETFRDYNVKSGGNYTDHWVLEF